MVPVAIGWFRVADEVSPCALGQKICGSQEKSDPLMRGKRCLEEVKFANGESELLGKRRPSHHRLRVATLDECCIDWE